MDNYLKEILAFVYYGLIVNNRPKMVTNNITKQYNNRNTEKLTIVHTRTPNRWIDTDQTFGMLRQSWAFAVRL